MWPLAQWGVLTCGDRALIRRLATEGGNEGGDRKVVGNLPDDGGIGSSLVGAASVWAGEYRVVVCGAEGTCVCPAPR